MLAGAAMLTGSQCEQIQTALLDAFDKASLSEMVLFSLDERLEQISTADNLRTITLDLVRWADEKGRVIELLDGALAANQRNERLISLRESASGWHVTVRALPAAECPYKGLAPFDEQDASLFFGRDRLTAELVEHLREHRFLAVVGASGSGKSSLVCAGVLPAIRRGAIAGSDKWLVEVIKPDSHPLTELAGALTRGIESTTAQTTATDDMAKEPRSLDILVRRQLDGQVPPARRSRDERHMLLVIDQFEELFTLCADKTERKAFVDNLLCAASEDGVTSIVITLRADFYHRCAEFDALRLAIQDRQKYIGPMSEGELRDAIVKPAEQVGWEFEAGLVDRIAREVADQPGSLPLLSQALYETWNSSSRQGGCLLTFAAYYEAGGVQGAIERTADSVYGAMSPAQQEIARAIFLHLTLVSEDIQATRRRMPLEDLTGSGERAAQIEAVINKLEDKRLITADRQRLVANGGTREVVYVDVAHEALIRNWKVLGGWLEESRTQLLLLQQTASDARMWAPGHDESYLYRGARLRQVREIARAQPDRVTAGEREFIAASLRAQRRQRLLLAVAAILGVTVVAAAVGARAFSREIMSAIYRPLPLVVSEVPAGAFVMGSTPDETDAAQELLALDNGAACGGTSGTAGTAGTDEVSGDAGMFGLMEMSIVLDQEMPEHAVELDGFRIDRYEVSNAAYHQCERALVCTAPGAGEVERLAQPADPVVLVTYNQAVAYCRWAGGDLPTEAQWEKAARGAEGGNRFPWGPDADASRANVCQAGGPAAVDAYDPQGNSVYEVANMAGNVWEWTRDWYDASYYRAGDQKNPPGPSFSPSNLRVVRGGSYQDGWIYARTTYRDGRAPDTPYSEVGFRCVYALAGSQ